MNRVTMFGAFALVFAISSGAQVGRSSTPVVVVETETSVISVHPETGHMKPNATPKYDGVVSPDGTRLAFTKVLGKGERSSRELFVATIGDAGVTKDEKQLTNGAGNATQLHWMPDSKRIMYVRGEGKYQQVYIAETDGEKLRETRASAGDARSSQPSLTPDGNVAYLVERRREGKAAYSDLVVVKDRKHTPVVKDTVIMGYAFSPDKTKLAYSTHSELVIHDLGSGKEEVRHFSTIDSRLNSFHAYSMAWSPDSTTIAALVHFSGGRAADAEGQIKPLSGEREVFIIPVQGGKAKSYPIDQQPRTVRWLKTQ